jgi:hypothetical protein
VTVRTVKPGPALVHQSTNPFTKSARPLNGTTPCSGCSNRFRAWALPALKFAGSGRYGAVNVNDRPAAYSNRHPAPTSLTIGWAPNAAQNPTDSTRAATGTATNRSVPYLAGERSKNPSPENLAQLLGRFDQGLRDEFEDFLHDGDERLYRDLSFLVDRRNRIAHGLNEGIGPQRALELVDAGQDMVDWFILRLNPYR